MSQQRDVKAKRRQTQLMPKAMDAKGNGCQRQWMSMQWMSKQIDVKGNGCQIEGMSKQRASFSHLQRLEFVICLAHKSFDFTSTTVGI